MIFPAPFDDPPAIIGTVSSFETLHAFPQRQSREQVPCHVLEARLDCIQSHGAWQDDWLPACTKIEAAGTPVLLTLRHQMEGGQWTGTDTGRLQHLLQAIDELASIDIEFQSALVEFLAERAADAGKAIVLSHHDFDQTPSADELRDLALRMSEIPNAVVKIATRASTQADVDRLRDLLSLELQNQNPICVIAMGPDWSETRVTFPQQGSAFTYAYLDTSAAPGQLSCTEVHERLTK